MMKKFLHLAVLFSLVVGPAVAQTIARPTAAPARVTAPAGLAPVAPAWPGAIPMAAAAGGKVDVNAATEAQLDTLPGVGPARAKAIIANRPYTDLGDLVAKKALSQSVFDGAKARMALANINTSSAADLAKTLPGIGDVRSKALVAGRPYATPQDVVSKGVLTQAQFDKVKDLVAY
jgi:DNA uptake protein ComE-like DNA-binding protein